MIIGNLNNTSRYEDMHPQFKDAFKFLKNLDVAEQPLGQVNLKDDDLFIKVYGVDLIPQEKCKLELHRKYIDIQAPISGNESYGWAPRNQLIAPIESFDEEKDIQFFYDRPLSIFSLIPGNFAIFFPEDAHAPCIGDGSLKKVVIKIKAWS